MTPSQWYSTGITPNQVERYRDITKTEYEDWKQQFTVDALRGQRYGQSFCNRFGITDNLLYFTTEIEWCDDYIRKQYLARQ